MQHRPQDVDAGQTEGLESREVYNHIVSLTPQWRRSLRGAERRPWGISLVQRFPVTESREQAETVAVDEEARWTLRLVTRVVWIFQIVGTPGRCA